MTFGFGGVELILAAMFYSGMGLPLGVPPEPEDPLLMRVAPEDCLYFTTWAGMAKPDGASANQTEALIAEPQVQKLIAEIDRRMAEGFKKLAGRARDPEEVFMSELAPLWGRTLLTHATAIYVTKFEVPRDAAPIVEAGAVVNTGDDTLKIKASIEKLQETFLKDKVKEVEIVGTKFYRFQVDEKTPEITWGTKGKYLLVGIGKGSMEATFDNIRRGPPKWLTDIKAKYPVERVSSITYSNLQATIASTFAALGDEGDEAKRIFTALGLGQVTNYASVTGLDKDGFVSRSSIKIDGEPRGLLMLAAGKPLAAGDLETIPADANVAFALRLDVDKAITQGIALAKEIQPNAAEQIDETIAQINQMIGLDVQKDVVQSLGDTWCIYNSPEEGGTFFTGATATIAVRDHAQLVKAEKQLLALARAALQGPGGDEEEFADPDKPQLKQIVVGKHTIHYVTAGEMPLAPAWCLTESHLVVSIMPQNIQSLLARDDKFQSIAKNAEVARLLAEKNGPQALTYVDTRKVFDVVYPLVQMGAQAAFNNLQREGIEIDASILPMSQTISRHLRPSVATVTRTADGIEFSREQSLPGSSAGSTTPVMVALLLPAVNAAREAARRNGSMNNMRQIALAMMNSESAIKRFPSDIKLKDGAPGLSWRVAILPYIEERALYDEFKRDEPWDSEHNLKLLERIPATLRSPNSNAAPGMTNYLGISGEKGIFRPGEKGASLREMGDGISKTVVVVEVDDELAVPWTKPDDYDPDVRAFMEGLGHHRAGGIFLAVFADCHAMAISNEVDEALLRAVFTINGGEAVNEAALYDTAGDDVFSSDGATETPAEDRPLIEEEELEFEEAVP